ncbi:MAG: hypothetical protein Q4C54_08050 [Clostridia bacterium]|nr:hypothetical protein [Clostridia bacterium]
MKKISAFWSLMLLTFCLGHAGALTLAHATDLHYLSPDLSNDSPYLAQLLKQGDGKAALYT